MIKSEGYPHGPTLTAKQRAAQIAEQIIAQTQNVTDEMFSDEEFDGDSGCKLTDKERADIERHISDFGFRLHKVIEKTIAAIDGK